MSSASGKPMIDEAEEPLLHAQNEVAIKLYKRRWLIIAIFVAYTALSALQWVEYTIISDIIIKYYNVSATAVQWTSIVYMACYAPLLVPASYIVNKKGLRTAALIGGLGTATGTIIKVFSVQQNLFWVVLLGQTILAISQTLIISLPPRIAAVWFGAHEVSTACGLGIFGSQFGTGLGFFLPGLIVHDNDDVQQIGKDLHVLCWILAAASIPISIAIIFFFPKFPRLPPSVTQVLERSENRELSNSEFFNSFKELFKHDGFWLHVLSFGINIAAFSTIGTLLNQYIIWYFPHTRHAGLLGLLSVAAGMVGIIFSGILLDRTRKFKECCVFVYSMSTIGVIGLMLTLHYKLTFLMYLSVVFFGFFTAAYWTAGFEMAMELTHPSPQMMTGGVTMGAGQVLGVIATVFAGKILELYGPFWSLTSQAVLLSIGVITTVLTPDVLKRQEAFLVNANYASDEIQGDQQEVIPSC